jgi:hypothetical protein
MFRNLKLIIQEYIKMDEKLLRLVCRDYMKKELDKEGKLVHKCERESCRFIHDAKLCKNYYRNYQNNGRGTCKYKDNCKKNHYVTDNRTMKFKDDNRKTNFTENRTRERMAKNTDDNRKTNITENRTRERRVKNTISWEPPSPPYDIRLIVDTSEKRLNENKYDKVKLTANDVVVVPNIFKQNRGEIYDKLVKELEECKVPKEDLLKLWHGSEERGIKGTHLICDDHTNWKKDCPMFTNVIDQLIDFFNVKPSATRLNWYTNHKDFKPLHRDSSALYPEKQKKQNITIAVSFGQTRDIVFEHLETKKKICIQQGDGDVYTFGNQVNIDWRHGVSCGKEDQNLSGRISIIIWGFVDEN